MMVIKVHFTKKNKDSVNEKMTRGFIKSNVEKYMS